MQLTFLVLIYFPFKSFKRIKIIKKKNPYLVILSSLSLSLSKNNISFQDLIRTKDGV